MTRATAILGQQVRNRETTIGNVADLLYDPESGTVMQILIDLNQPLMDFKGPHLAVSIDRLKVPPTSKMPAVFQITQQDLEPVRHPDREQPPQAEDNGGFFRYRAMDPIGVAHTVFPYGPVLAPTGAAIPQMAPHSARREEQVEKDGMELTLLSMKNLMQWKAVSLEGKTQDIVDVGLSGDCRQVLAVYTGDGTCIEVPWIQVDEVKPESERIVYHLAA